MNESQVFEKFGRMQFEIDRLNAAYDHIAKALADVVAGELDPSRVLVNLTDRTYTIAPEGERPAMPATINGKPECVVAPPKVPMVSDICVETPPDAADPA